jgi:hypothetical protein
MDFVETTLTFINCAHYKTNSVLNELFCSLLF